jgi:hypothetical protein
LFTPVGTNLPPPPAVDVDINVDKRVAPPAPAEMEARRTAIPEAPPRDVGAGRPDGRRKPLALAVVTLVDDGATCAAICLFL